MHNLDTNDLNEVNENKETPRPLDLVLGVTEIMELLPHRYPFLLIDRLKDIIPFESATGVKMVSSGDWYFQGHFPGHPIMPGVLIIEAMAQTAGALIGQSMGKSSSEPNMVYFMSVEDAKFRKPVVPGDVLELRVQKERSRGNVWRFKGKAFVDGKVTDEATFTAMIVNS